MRYAANLTQVEILVLDPEAAGRPVREHLALRPAERDRPGEDSGRRLNALGGGDLIGRRP